MQDLKKLIVDQKMGNNNNSYFPGIAYVKLFLVPIVLVKDVNIIVCG